MDHVDPDQQNAFLAWSQPSLSLWTWLAVPRQDPGLQVDFPAGPQFCLFTTNLLDDLDCRLNVAVISGTILLPLLSWRTGPWLVRSLLCWPPDSLSSYPLRSSPAPPTPWQFTWDVLNLELNAVEPGLCLCGGFLLWTLPADQPCSGLLSPNSTDAFIIPSLLRKPLWVFLFSGGLCSLSKILLGPRPP